MEDQEMTSAASSNNNAEELNSIPHAFHLNLPPHHFDKDGTPFITKFAHMKARKIVQLALSIRLTEDLYVEGFEEVDEDDEEEGDSNMMDAEKMEEDAVEVDSSHRPSAQHQPKETLSSIIKKCARLQSQLSTLESLKYNGITQLELCEMILHVLRLLTATVTIHYETTTTATTTTNSHTTTKSTKISSDTTMTSNATDSNSISGPAAAISTNGIDSNDGDISAPMNGGLVDIRRGRKAKLHYENVGYLYKGVDEPCTKNPSSLSDLEDDLKQNFALPAPAREVLLFFLISMLGNKGPLRSVSNAAVYADDVNEQERFLLILHWRPLLRMLLRTAPYLDEHKVGNPPKASNSRLSTILQRTVQLIRDARHFFDQGIRPPLSSASTTPVVREKDCTAREIWNMVKKDVLYHSHTHACYRSTIILYLFQPSRCTSEYYLEVLPYWVESWTNIDRCPEYDFLWLAMFCRARKHVSPLDYDWGPIRRRILTLSQYWLQLPIGGISLDKSFPRAANPRSRSCPSRLKDFVGAGSSYEEGIDFVAKVTKLLVNSLGTGGSKAKNPEQNSTEPATADASISEGTRDILRFLSFATPYFNPSNLGSWTFTLGAFLHYFSYELCCRVGNAAGMESLKSSNPGLARALCDVQPSLAFAAIPAQEMAALMNALLPLCQQALYSKNGHVGRAGEAAMLYLVQIDPVHSTPAFIDFATRALDISAVNLSHQAPAALSALTRLIQPALRCNPCVLLARLPEILRLCLAGIDRNDQNKTIRTLILYRSITSWIPVGGRAEDWISSAIATSCDGNGEMTTNDSGTMCLGKDLYKYLSAAQTSSAYKKSLGELPPTSILRQGTDSDSSPEMCRLLVEEVVSATNDWVYEFLDRIFTFLRTSGEREKAGKTSSGVASRHSSVDVQQARNFSRVLKECLMQVFSATMDETVNSLAIRSVARFLQEDTLPSAAKDVSFLCQAVAGAREVRQEDGTSIICSPGLDALVPVLMDDLEHHSIKTVVYRLRCLSGAVRSASRGLIKHQLEIKRAIDFALASNDKHLFKTGCKLLRHTLASLCESYPLFTDNRPRTATPVCEDFPLTLGRSAQFHGDSVHWHVPDKDTIEFAWDLMNCHIIQRIESMLSETVSTTNDGVSNDCPATNEKNMDTEEKPEKTLDIQKLRRCLRVIRYCLRGGAGILLDFDEGMETEGDNNRIDTLQRDDPDLFLSPHEQATLQLLSTATAETRDSILQIRGRLCSFMVGISSIISSEMFYSRAFSDTTSDAAADGSTDRRYLSLISSDSKVCKEVCDIALLLLTRRGASFRSQEAKNIWKAQKQSATDFSLCAMADFMVESLQRGACYCDSKQILYKDGEDGGKTIPRRLLVSRVQLFHDSLQRNSSFEIPRRLNRFSKLNRSSRKQILYKFNPSISELTTNLTKVMTSKPPRALDGYDGLVDGLFALCCHSHTQVRAAGIGVVDYAITRFGWLVSSRIPRLLSAISLQDGKINGKFGIPSCAKLLDHVDGQGKRKRLAESMKGVCSLLSLPRAIKELMTTDATRFSYIKTFCGTDNLISLLPPEEIQKMVHYLQGVFSKFRSKFYQMPRASVRDQQIHEANLGFLLDILSEKDVIDTTEQADKGAAHWRKLLLVCWFIMSLVDEDDLCMSKGALSSRLWTTCFRVLENEMGQPLQRVALGLFGRLVALIRDDIGGSLLRDRMITESFCRLVGQALVYDHKEDASFGGGHDAQWSAGVEDVIRDASRNVAPRSLFPFQRTSQSSTTFKISHAQLVAQILVGLGNSEDARVSAQYLLSFAKEIAASPPSEDQRNQLCTSAEIFSGVCKAFLELTDDNNVTAVWTSIFLPYLDEVVLKVPVSFIGAYFDALRFALQFSPPNAFYPLTAWLFGKVESTLWQPKSVSEKPPDCSEENDQQGTNGSSLGTTGTDGFTSQSKWLYLCCALLIEIDETEVDGTMSRIPWYTTHLVGESMAVDSKPEPHAVEKLEKSWDLVSDKLLPYLTAAIGHPYESCRDHISGCLFRICHCHRKKMRVTASRSPQNAQNTNQVNSFTHERLDPGTFIVRKLESLENADSWSFTDRFNALMTTRRFFSYCIHMGEAKHEFSDYIIPLLPLAFEALKSTVEEATESTDPAKRALEAEVVKGYRYTIAELSITSVISYGRDEDIARVLEVVGQTSKHELWQVRHASAHFLRCFQGGHKFLFGEIHATKTLSIVTHLLADDRREVSSAAMAALTGILAASPNETVAKMVKKYVSIANRSTMKRRKKGVAAAKGTPGTPDDATAIAKEQKRARNQLTSVFFLCASVLSQPYDTPPYVPEALAAISKHSFERNAPLGVRDTVKKCCAEYKRTHMSDNWELHRNVFTQEQLEALEDVVSTPHYYA